MLMLSGHFCTSLHVGHATRSRWVLDYRTNAGSIDLIIFITLALECGLLQSIKKKWEDVLIFACMYFMVGMHLPHFLEMLWCPLPHMT